MLLLRVCPRRAEVVAADLKSARQGSIDGSTLPVVLFDRDCGFCQWSIALIPKIGAHVLLLPITPNNLARYRLDPVRAKLEMPLVLPQGGVRWGSRAWVEILLVARWPYRILGARPVCRGYRSWWLRYIARSLFIVGRCRMVLHARLDEPASPGFREYCSFFGNIFGECAWRFVQMAVR